MSLPTASSLSVTDSNSHIARCSDNSGDEATTSASLSFLRITELLGNIGCWPSTVPFTVHMHCVSSTAAELHDVLMLTWGYQKTPAMALTGVCRFLAVIGIHLGRQGLFAFIVRDIFINYWVAQSGRQVHRANGHRRRRHWYLGREEHQLYILILHCYIEQLPIWILPQHRRILVMQVVPPTTRMSSPYLWRYHLLSLLFSSPIP
jgi:hypothetical protein